MVIALRYNPVKERNVHRTWEYNIQGYDPSLKGTLGVDSSLYSSRVDDVKN